jgi:hypothetical protein
MSSVAFSLALIGSEFFSASASSSGCYTAEIAQWVWCTGYEKVGYTCANGFCSVDSCDASCTNCADFYPNASFDKSTARCCSSLGPGGSCVDPLPGDAPYNPPYGFPNNGPGALIVEGPVPYPNSPPCWSDTTQLGAYGFTALVQPGKTDKECPAPHTSGAWIPPHGLRPISLRPHGEPISACMLACNITEVALTGIDPCNTASIYNNSTETSLKGVFANYSCYYGGESWIHPADVGVCGFNCSAHHVDTGAPCSSADIEKDLCDIYCDSRDLNWNASARAAVRGSPIRKTLK